jgi:ankyrin repeat protein
MRAGTIIGSIALLWVCLAGVTAGAGSEVADAAQRGDRAVVQKLLASKADVNAAQVDGATALHWAVYRGDLELTDILIRGGANVKAANRARVTPLAMASLYGNAALIDRLVKAGADVKERGPNGETMVMFAARNGNPEAIRLLVEAGADVNARETLRGTTALMWAAEQKHPAAVKALLAAGADPALKSGGAGLPRNYMANRVNARVVDQAGERRKRAREAGRTYEEQLDFEQRNGVDIGGQRGLAQALGAGGVPLQGGRGQGGAPPQNAPAAAPGAAAPAASTPAPAAPAAASPGAASPAAATPEAATPAAAAPQGRNGGAGGGRGRGAGAGRAGGQGAAQAQAEPADDPDDTEVVVAGLVGSGGGGLTALVFAAREGDLESARALLDADADVNQVTEYGWTPLLTAINNRNYQVAQLLIERGADVNRANKGGWTPLYLATDNRNIEGGDYPVPKADLDHLDIIKLMLEKGANPNLKVKDNTLTRTIFTMQWFFEDGATPFIRAAQSSDTELMQLLLEHGADPKAATANLDNALTASGGIGWVEGVTYERSQKSNYEAMKMLLDLGLDPNHQNAEGRTALMGAAMKGRSEIIQLLVDRGAKLETKDKGSRDTDKVGSSAAGHRWQAIDYADGLVRVGVQSAVERPEASALIRKLMEERGLPTPPKERSILSICVVALCDGTQ